MRRIRVIIMSLILVVGSVGGSVYAGNPVEVMALTVVGSLDEGKSEITFAEVAEAANYYYMITDESITPPLDDEAVPVEAVQCVEDSYIIVTGKYIHIYAVTDGGSLKGYGEHVMEAHEISTVLNNITVSAGTGTTQNTSIINLVNVPTDVDSIRYSVSNNALINVYTSLEEPTSYSEIVSGVTEVIISSGDYVHIYASKDGYVTGFGQHQMLAGEIQPPEPLLATVTPLNNSYDNSTENHMVITFSEAIKQMNGSEMTASSIASYVTLYETNASGQSVDCVGTISADKKVITMDPIGLLDQGQKYHLTISDQVKSSHNAQFAGSSYDYTVGPELLIDIDDADDLFTYDEVENGHYYIKVIPDESAASVPTGAGEVIDSVKEQRETPYDHLDFVGYIVDSTDDQSSSSVNLGLLAPDKEHLAYIAFEGEDGHVFSQFESFGFTTDDYIPLIQGLAFSDDSSSDLKTIITLPVASGGNTYVYKVSDSSGPIDRPTSSTDLTSWIPVVNGGIIEALDDAYINVAEVNAGTIAQKYASGRAISKVENPFEGDLLYEFVSQSTLQITYELLATKASTIHYAIYDGNKDMTTIDYNDVLLGRGNPIAYSHFEANTTGGMEVQLGVLNTVDELIYGDVTIAIIPKVKSADNYYEVVTYFKIDGEDTNSSYEMEIGHKVGLSLVSAPGTGVNDPGRATQVITSVEKHFQYSESVGDNNADDLRIAFIEQNILKDKKYYEIKNLLRNDITTYIDQDKAMELPYVAGILEQDVSALPPGYYTALIYNANPNVGDKYGDFTTEPLEDAFFRAKEGPVNALVHTIFEGESSCAIFEFDNIVTPVAGEHFFETGGEAIDYDNVFLSSPVTDDVEWTFDFENFKTYAKIVYSEAQVVLEAGKEISFNLNENCFDVSNGNPLSNLLLTTEVKNMLSGVVFDSYYKTQPIQITNEYGVDINYVLVHQSLVASIPSQHNMMADFIAANTGKIASCVISKNSSGNIDINQMDIGEYKMFAYPMNSLDDLFITETSGLSIEIIEQQSSNEIGNSSGSDKLVTVEATALDNLKAKVLEMTKGDDPSAKLEAFNQLLELVNQAIEVEGKVVMPKDGVVTVADLLEAIKKGALIRNEMIKKLGDMGIDIDVKRLKISLRIEADIASDGHSSIEITKEALEELSREVDNLQLDFAGTLIQIDKAVIANAKENMTFTIEEVLNSLYQKPMGHEQSDIVIRKVEAYYGERHVEAFVKPVKVFFGVEDFGFDPKDGQDLSSLVVMVLNEESGVWELTGGNYDPITNRISFYRIHMSQYTVVMNERTFADVENTWSKDAINALLGKGIVDDKTMFRPHDAITREEFCAWICRAYGLREAVYSELFEDVDEDNPYYNELSNARNQGLIFGRNGKVFAPKDTITRQEVATLIVRALSKYNELQMPDDRTTRWVRPTDSDKISNWAADYVGMVIDLGIMTVDSNGDFNPQGTISREDAVGLFVKAYK